MKPATFPIPGPWYTSGLWPVWNWVHAKPEKLGTAELGDFGKSLSPSPRNKSMAGDFCKYCQENCRDFTAVSSNEPWLKAWVHEHTHHLISYDHIIRSFSVTWRTRINFHRIVSHIFYGLPFWLSSNISGYRRCIIVNHQIPIHSAVSNDLKSYYIRYK